MAGNLGELIVCESVRVSLPYQVSRNSFPRSLALPEGIAVPLQTGWEGIRTASPGPPTGHPDRIVLGF